jgi:hypothetical protein
MRVVSALIIVTDQMVIIVEGEDNTLHTRPAQIAHENRGVAGIATLPSMMSVLMSASPLALGHGFSRSVGLNSGHRSPVTWSHEKVRWNSDRRGNMSDVNCVA